MQQPMTTGWTLTAEHVQHWHEAPVNEVLDAQSLPIRLYGWKTATRMPLFSSLAVEVCSCPVASSTDQQQAGDAAPADDPAAAVEATFNVDCAFYAGGPVWSLDWCPLTGTAASAGPLQTVETLAVATHPRSAPRNPMNVAQQGAGVVQVWGVPSSAECSLIPGGLPRVLALLWHEGKLAWDVKWCPAPSTFIQTSSSSSSSASTCATGMVPVQGLLAAALANGDVVVWGVPAAHHLIHLAQQQLPQHDQAAPAVQIGQQPSALSLRLPYVWQIRAAAVGGSLCSCCSWLPTAPHNKLLVGCWDGKVVIWQLSMSTQGAPSAVPVQMLAADHTAIRAVAWQPNSRWWMTGAPDQLQQVHQQLHQQPGQAGGHSHLFITGSNTGNIKVWDVHDVLQACQERMVTRYAINAALWLGPPHMWLTASADGSIRCFWVDAGVQATNIPQVSADVSGRCGNVWGLSASVPMAVAAYVGDGGLLGLMPLEPSTGEPRHRKSHAAISSMTMQGDELWLLGPRHLEGNEGLYQNLGKEQGAAAKRAEAAQYVLDPLPHPGQVLYAVAFSPNFRGLAMLAAGGGAGLVRLHAVSAEVVPVGW